jgi:hypothetical protein
MLRERDVPREKVEWIKDGPQKDLLGRYTTFSWTSLCDAVLKIPVLLSAGTAGKPSSLLPALLPENRTPKNLEQSQPLESTSTMWRRRESNPRPEAFNPPTLRA